MNFEQFKTEFKSQYVTVVKDEERGIIAVLSNLDKFIQAIEENMDHKLVSIDSCDTFGYGYIGEIKVTMKDEYDDAEFSITYELISTTLY